MGVLFAPSSMALVDNKHRARRVRKLRGELAPSVEDHQVDKRRLRMTWPGEDGELRGFQAELLLKCHIPLIDEGDCRNQDNDSLHDSSLRCVGDTCFGKQRL